MMFRKVNIVGKCYGAQIYIGAIMSKWEMAALRGYTNKYSKGIA